MDYEALISLVAMTVFLVFLIAQLFVMPFFLHRLRKHDEMAFRALNVAWHRVFLDFTIASMFFFLMNDRFLEYPEDLHRQGKILKLTWAYPLLLVGIGLIVLLIVLSLFSLS